MSLLDTLGDVAANAGPPGVELNFGRDEGPELTDSAQSGVDFGDQVIENAGPPGVILGIGDPSGIRLTDSAQQGLDDANDAAEDATGQDLQTLIKAGITIGIIAGLLYLLRPLFTIAGGLLE